MLPKFVKDLKRDRRSLARSFEEGFRMYAREAAPEYISSMIFETNFPSVSEDQLSDD